MFPSNEFKTKIMELIYSTQRSKFSHVLIGRFSKNENSPENYL